MASLQDYVWHCLVKDYPDEIILRIFDDALESAEQGHIPPKDGANPAIYAVVMSFIKGNRMEKTADTPEIGFRGLMDDVVGHCRAQSIPARKIDALTALIDNWIEANQSRIESIDLEPLREHAQLQHEVRKLNERPAPRGRSTL